MADNKEESEHHMQEKIRADTKSVSKNFKPVRMYESFETMLQQCLTKALRQVQLERKRQEQLEMFAQTKVIAPTISSDTNGVKGTEMTASITTITCIESTESSSSKNNDDSTQVNKGAPAQNGPVLVTEAKDVEGLQKDTIRMQPRVPLPCKEVYKANIRRRRRLHFKPHVGEARKYEANGEMVIMRGIRFGNLTPIPTVRGLDPNKFDCFNCRLFGHDARDCTREYREHCNNCGRLDTQIYTCPRCSAAYWRDGYYEEEQWDYFKNMTSDKPDGNLPFESLIVHILEQLNGCSVDYKEKVIRHIYGISQRH